MGFSEAEICTRRVEHLKSLAFERQRILEEYCLSKLRLNMTIVDHHF